MDDGALIGREVGEGLGQSAAKFLFIRVGGGGENGLGIGGQLFILFLARAAASDEVDGQIMGEAEEIGAGFADVGQGIRIAGEFDEEFLEEVAGVGFVA